MGTPPPHTHFLITGPHGSSGCLQLVRGQCCMAKVIVPCCQRLPGPAGSQTVCVSSVLLTQSRVPFQACSKHIFKIFVNLNGFKYLNRHERVTAKSVEEPESSCKISETEQFHMNFQIFSSGIFRIWSSSSVFMPPQVNTRNYLAMSQIRSHHSD